ncbi:hypothetical protein [Arthrobacter globiformis]|uniref:hypothetical protein n=1 Tax=Arthrobacter globiformis TaxID=1665 RepID=UPI001FE063FA|nr:hypothetical protein [Arthrobacter globiformis]
MSISKWWPLFQAGTRTWLIEHNGEPLPPPVKATSPGLRAARLILRGGGLANQPPVRSFPRFWTGSRLSPMTRSRRPAEISAPTTNTQLLRIMGDSRGPAVVAAGLSDQELARLLDGLYRNLDTRAPEPDAILWYEICVEESRRRAN